MKQDRLWPAVLIGWGLAALVLTIVSARAIAHLWFPDPDDAMRLIEVRDWIGGQSWWDVGQHRLNGGDFRMHWSRLVDLPLAGAMIVFAPFGPALSVRAAMWLVPMTTLLATIALAAALTRRLGDTERARLSILLTPLSVPIIYQMLPMRIDHHGWQIVLALAAVLALVARPVARNGAIIGICLATLLTISLEGLPITAAIIGVAALAWAFDPARRSQLAAMVLALSGATLLLHLATRWPSALAPTCDAVSPVWIAALAAVSIGLGGAIVLRPASLPVRLALVAGSGLAALAVIVIVDPGCTQGPFATLDPLVRRIWYDNVSEGLPVWRQVPAWAALTIGFPIFGLIGTALALRRAWASDDAAARDRWILLLAVAGLAFLLSILVMRAGGTANALALPGGAWLLQEMLLRARRIGPVLPRTLATAGSLAAAAPGITACALIGLPSAQARPTTSSSSAVARPICDRGHEMADLGRLPPSVIFAPVDVTPELLAWTPHRAIAGGYHRNGAAIHRVLATFMGSPAAARARVIASGAAYVAGCPGENETELYKHFAPDGFWARLERGDRFDWLAPVPMPGSPVLVWRVITPPLSAAAAHR